MSHEEAVKIALDAIENLSAHIGAAIEPEDHLALARAVLDMDAEIKASAWRSIETAPRDGTWVLLSDPSFEYMQVAMGIYYREDGRDVETGRFKAGDWCLMETDGMPSHANPTHWQPLPPPPSHNDEENG